MTSENKKTPSKENNNLSSYGYFMPFISPADETILNIWVNGENFYKVYLPPNSGVDIQILLGGKNDK